MAKTRGYSRSSKFRSVAVPTCNFGIQNKRATQKSRIKRVSWRDEQIEGMSVSDVPEFNDPAILVVKESITIRYSKDELIKLRDVPLSKKKPDFFEALEVPPSILDPERWPFDRKKTSDIPENTSGPEHRCRPRGDPRERIRKENDGIVLSPQRRSFKSGCFVLARCDTAGNNNRPHSPLGGKNESSHIGIREVQPNARRIGSGRIIRDTWDFNDKSEIGDSENYSGFRNQRGSSNVDEKYERRSFGRDFEINRDRENNNKDPRRNGGRFERRRISENRDIEEPEWFSGGPASQNDTIELRGFDDEKPRKKKLSPSRVKRAKEWSKKKEAQQNPDDKDDSKDPTNHSAPNLQADAEISDVDVSKQTEQEKKTVEEKQEGPSISNNNTNSSEETKASSMMGDHSFNFDDILKCDTIPGLLTNGVGGDGDNTKSRFTRWFKQESPEHQDSRRSSLHDENNIIKGLLSDISETSITIPGDSDAYFAPISPANNNLGGVIGNKTITSQPKQQSQPINIMEMLQRSNQRLERETVKHQPQPVMGKILSLDELEAKIRQNADVNSGVGQKPPQKPDEEMTAAFKKLLAQAQAAGGHSVTSNGPVSKPQPMSLLEMLNHSQQQDEAARISAAAAAAHMLGPISPNVLHHHHSAHIASELTLKLQQAQLQQQQQKQQMEMLNKLINATTAAHQMHVDVGMQQQSRDLLNRPEAQAILQAMHQRIPSPRELQVHTQNILQRALIKKKLEEQQENYRKKQEMQRGQSPNTNSTQSTTKSVASPTPLAFTPTSVLRKMTADKDESKENKITADTKIPPGRPVTGIRPQPPQPQVNPQWSTQFGVLKQPAGRPIVKANNYQTQTPEQFFSQHQQQQQQQQRLFNTVQPVLSAAQQQRKQPAVPQFGNSVQSSVSGGQYNQPQYPSTNQQFGQQLTQQQLRAQHQHRPTNQAMTSQGQQTQQQQNQQSMGAWQQLFGNVQQRANRSINNPLTRSLNEAGNLSPTTTNQLAQWFSPDLLERARGGELPSTAGLAQHVLSLEEIERQTAPPVHN